VQLDVVDLRAFYDDRLGRIARLSIARRLKTLWPAVAGNRVVGIGYATPYLRDVGKHTERVLAFMPAAQGVVTWPNDGPNAAALVEEDCLPLTDASVDRVLAVHLLEGATNPPEVLREIWRVLAPGGRLIAVVPNRSGIWARVEATPFGCGRPFGRIQLTALLRDALFSPLNWTEALAMPPFRWRALLGRGITWDRIGRSAWPAFAGVIIVEATKQLYQGVPARALPRAKVKLGLRPALIPPGYRVPAG
jgi:SAM-dependent methyltransferase